MQDDTGAALSLLDRGDFEFALALRGPVDTLFRRRTGAAAKHFHLVGNDERRVEADAELANQVRILLLVAGQVFHEIGGAGLGDGAQVGHHVVAVHADAVVIEGNGLGVLVEADANPQIAATFEQLGLGQRLEAQLVGSVGSVGDQLAKEDFLVRVQRMNHQVKQLLHFGLEAQGFFVLSFHTHRLRTPHRQWHGPRSRR